MEFIVAYAIGSIVSFFLIWGWWVAYFTGKYPDVTDFREELGHGFPFAIFSGLFFWPIGIPLVLGLSGFAKYGWRLTPINSPSLNPASKHKSRSSSGS